MLAGVREGTAAYQRERVGNRDAQIAAGYSRAVVAGGKKIGTIVEALAPEQ